MSNLVVTGGKWESTGSVSADGSLAFGRGTSTLRWDTSIPGVQQVIKFATDSQSSAYTAVQPGGELIIGRFDITAALTGDEVEPFINRLNINVKVDGKRYPLPIDVQVAVIGGAIAVSLGVQVPFTVNYDSFAVKILGISDSRNSETASGGAIANPGTTATFFLFAEILETPTEGPVPPASGTSAPFNSKECFVGEPIDPIEPGIPAIPIIPDPIPIDPIIPICGIDIDIPDPPIVVVMPPLPPIPPGPPGNPGTGCIPYITAEKQCVETCEGGASDIQIIPYGNCNYHIVLFEHCCYNPPPCCDWICCDGDWTLYQGYPKNDCCGNQGCFDLTKWHIEVYNTEDKAEPPPSGDGGCWYMTDIWDCTFDEDHPEDVGCCTYIPGGEGEAVQENMAANQCSSLDGIFDEEPCGVTGEVYQELSYIYTGCGEQGGVDLAEELSLMGWETAGPFEGAWEPPVDEEGECNHIVVQEPPPCGDREEGEEQEEPEEPVSCGEAPTCPCLCEGMVMKVCDDCTTTPPPPPPCDAECLYLGKRMYQSSTGNYYYEWELVQPCPDEDCCCPTPDKAPTSVDDEYLATCLAGRTQAQCTTTTVQPCTDHENCQWELAYDDYDGPYWENIIDDCYDYSEGEQNCCCPYPENVDPDEYNPRGGNYEIGDTINLLCTDETDGYCTTTEPPTGCCLRCQEGQGHGGIVTEDITQAECDELDDGDTVWSPTCPPTVCCESSFEEYETKYEGCCDFNTVDPQLCLPQGCCTYTDYAGTHAVQTGETECDLLGGTWLGGQECPETTTTTTTTLPPCLAKNIMAMSIQGFAAQEPPGINCQAAFQANPNIQVMTGNSITITGTWTGIDGGVLTGIKNPTPGTVTLTHNGSTWTLNTTVPWGGNFTGTLPYQCGGTFVMPLSGNTSNVCSSVWQNATATWTYN